MHCVGRGEGGRARSPPGGSSTRASKAVLAGRRGSGGSAGLCVRGHRACTRKAGCPARLALRLPARRSVAVVGGLVGAVGGDADILGLAVCQARELGAQLGQVQRGDLRAGEDVCVWQGGALVLRRRPTAQRPIAGNSPHHPSSITPPPPPTHPPSHPGAWAAHTPSSRTCRWCARSTAPAARSPAERAVGGGGGGGGGGKVRCTRRSGAGRHTRIGACMHARTHPPTQFCPLAHPHTPHSHRACPSSPAPPPPPPCQPSMRARLVGEGAGHDKGGVAGGAAQVEQAPLRQHNHAVAVGEDEAIHLGLDVLPASEQGGRGGGEAGGEGWRGERGGGGEGGRAGEVGRGQASGGGRAGRSARA